MKTVLKTVLKTPQRHNASNFDKMADNEYSATEFHLKNALIY